MQIDALRSRGATMALAVAGALLVSACAVPDRYTPVDHAKTMLLGLSEDDVTMCAGFPDRKQDRENVHIWSYRHKTDGGNVNVSAPVLSGIANTSVNYSSGGDCSVQFLFVDGRVRRVAYAGDNDTASGRDMLCAPVIDDCMRYVAERPQVARPTSAPPQGPGPRGIGTSGPQTIPRDRPLTPPPAEAGAGRTDPPADRRP